MRRGPAAAGEHGFTLVEMLVALAIFGIVAAVGVALAGSALGAVARSEAMLGEASAIERTRIALAADLGQAAPRVSLGSGQDPLPAFLLGPEGFVLVRRGARGLSPAVQKIAWGFDGSRLMRQTFTRVDGGAPGPAEVMLEGVREVRIRVAGEAGWVDAWLPAQPEALPRALELTLVTDRGAPLVLRFLVAA